MNDKNTKSLKMKKLLSLILVYLVALALAVVANIVSPGFLAPDHIGSIFRQMAFLGIVCIGQTFVIMTAGIDLSVRYTLVLCNVVSAQLINGSNDNTCGTFRMSRDLRRNRSNEWTRCLLPEDSAHDNDSRDG